MLDLFKLRIKVMGKTAAIVEYIFAAAIAIAGILSAGKIYIELERRINISIFPIMLALTILILIATQIEYGNHIWDGAVEQIFILGGDEKLLRKYFIIHFIPIWVMSVCICLPLNFPSYGLWLDICWMSVVFWLSNYVIFSVFLDKGKRHTKSGISFFSVNTGNLAFRSILRCYQVRHRYILREAFKLLIIVGVAALSFLGLRTEYLTMFMLPAVVMICFSNDTYWNEEAGLMADLAARGFSYGFFISSNLAAALLDDLLVIMIAAAALNAFTPLLLIEAVWISVFFNVSAMYAAIKFRYTSVINSLLFVALGFLGFFPIANVIILVSMLIKVKHILTHEIEEL